MGRLLGVVAALALGLTVLAGCGSGASTFPTGKWTATDESSGDVALMDFRSDGTWALTANGQEVTAGTYATESGTFTFKTDTYCKGVGAEQGTYSWTHASEQLTLKKQDDSCTDRIGLVDGTAWKPAQ